MTNWTRLKDQKPADEQLCLVCGKAISPDLEQTITTIAKWNAEHGHFNLMSGWREAISHWQAYPQIPDDLK